MQLQFNQGNYNCSMWTIILLIQCLILPLNAELLKAEPSINIKINTTVINGKIAFSKEINLSQKTYKEINLQVDNDNNNDDQFGYAIVQVHSYAYNITLTLNQTHSENNTHQIGTNLGFLLRSSSKLFIHNYNHHIDCNLLLTVIAYNNKTPVPGGCNLEGNLNESPILLLTSDNDIIYVDTPSAALSLSQDPDQMLCSNITSTDLNYNPMYLYLPKNDFTIQSYFNGIKQFLEANYSMNIGLKANKKSTSGPGNRRSYIAVPGTGIVFNTIIQSNNGYAAAYIPTITYSCSPWLWENGCTIIPNSNAMKILGTILVVIGFLKVFVFFAEPFASLFLNSIPIGSYLAYRVLVYWDVSAEVRATFLILSGLSFAIIILVAGIQYIALAHLFSVITSVLFSWIFLLNAFYLFDGVNFSTNSTLFIIMFLFTVLSVLLIAIPYFRIIWLVINSVIGGYSLLIGLQIFTKSNLLMIFMQHFKSLNNTNYQYVNELPGPDKIDILIFIGLTGLIVLGMISKKKKILVCGRFSRYDTITDEHEPLITRWTHGSDEVFESPNTNHNFFIRAGQTPIWG